MPEVLDHLDHENSSDELKKRHACVTAWLIFMIVINSLTALVYFFLPDVLAENLPGRPAYIILLIVGGMSLLNAVFAVLLLQYKKLGFYGFAVISVIGVGLNIIMGISIGQSIFGLIGIGILYAILQIKDKDGVAAWERME